MPASLAATVWAKQILASQGITDPPPPAMWAASQVSPISLTAALNAHRLLPGAALMPDNRAAYVVPEVSATLTRSERTYRLGALRAAAVGARAKAVLGSRGIRSLFVKGIFQAQQTAGDFAARGVGDVDVLVPKSAYDEAVEALLADGATPLDAQVPTHLEHRMRQVVHAGAFSYQGLCIDLHRQLDPDFTIMNIDFDQLWERRAAVGIGGIQFDVLHHLDSCILVASHGGRDNWALLRSIVDFAQTARAASPPLDTTLLLEGAEEFGVRGRMEVAIEVARVLVPELPPQSARARGLAKWTWHRHSAGRLTRTSNSPRDSVGTFVYWTASEGNVASVRYACRRLMWLPSGMATAGLPERWAWATPLVAPATVAQRVVQRARGPH